MREELTAIFSKLGSNATKIAPFSSTRDVESLNTVVPSKDTKSRHYTENKAITGRVNCAVAQKNSGHGYVNKVHQEADLSPGKVLKMHDGTQDLKRRNRGESEAEFKRQRLEK